ncbi:MAG: hypothetical protein MnENMB40S_20350 [Rhizobiaceae bacterium MnEN-MB40S]|nr:MAG: hypothetical protein MnENMB40S_20350 [Rhizobiaceae bacterium MnEN-MB40S]
MGNSESNRGLEWHAGDMPYSTRFGDHFYARSDGRAECAHVFIAGNGLPDRWRGRDAFTIAELGFGTGLNFLETWRQWREHRHPSARLRFVSFEALPMRAAEMRRALGPWPQLESLANALIQAWPDNAPNLFAQDFDDGVRLEVHIGEALDRVCNWREQADAWYLDGFAPSRNPDMWSPALMQAVFDHTVPGGGFATYSAAGWVRRNLAAAGFEVLKQPGFAGKRDMSVGVRRD